MKQFISVILAIIMCGALLTGCGASSKTSQAVQGINGESFEKADIDSEGAGIEGGSSVELRPEEARKIIYKAELDLESKEFIKARDSILENAKKAQAYIQQSEEGGSEEKGTRWIRYTFRVPSEHYTEFLNGASASGNLLTKRESTEDVTAEYVDVEARLQSLRTQEQRLMELSAKAESLEDLLAIENQLSDVRYKIESYVGKQKVMDSLIQYSTVELVLNEVQVLTRTSPTFTSRLSEAFYDSWVDFAAAIQELLILAVYCLPALLMLGVLAAVLIPIVRKNRKKRAAHTLNAPQNTERSELEQKGQTHPKYDK